MKTENKKMNLTQPITMQLKISYCFTPSDHLPEDYEGTREDIVEWFRADIAENFGQWVTARELYEHIEEIQED